MPASVTLSSDVLNLILLTPCFKWVFSRLGRDSGLVFSLMRNKEREPCPPTPPHASTQLSSSSPSGCYLLPVCPRLYSEPAFKAIGWLSTYAGRSAAAQLWAAPASCLEGRRRGDVQIQYWAEWKVIIHGFWMQTHMFSVLWKSGLETVAIRPYEGSVSLVSVVSEYFPLSFAVCKNVNLLLRSQFAQWNC